MAGEQSHAVAESRTPGPVQTSPMSLRVAPSGDITHLIKVANPAFLYLPRTTLVSNAIYHRDLRSRL